MNDGSGEVPEKAAEQVVLEAQRAHWEATFTGRADMFGPEASVAAQAANALFGRERVTELLELGAGQGRDTLYFANAGLRVHALDYAEPGLAMIGGKAEAAGLGHLVTTVRHDVREPLPFAEGHFDACYSHMLFCMALTTPELVRLAAEVRRVLRPGGFVVYTARATADAHYRAGIDRGDDMWEMGGFIVHYFDRGLVERLADGYELVEVAELEEGELPRRLFNVVMRKAGT